MSIGGVQKRIAVVALGGNALLKRGEEMTDENQRKNARVAAQGMAQRVLHAYARKDESPLTAAHTASTREVPGLPLSTTLPLIPTFAHNTQASYSSTCSARPAHEET